MWIPFQATTLQKGHTSRPRVSLPAATLGTRASSPAPFRVL